MTKVNIIIGETWSGVYIDNKLKAEARSISLRDLRPFCPIHEMEVDVACSLLEIYLSKNDHFPKNYEAVEALKELENVFD